MTAPIPFTPYRVPINLSRRANRDIEFLWSSTYTTMFGTTPAGPNPNELDRLGITLCETIKNPFNFPITDIRLIHDYLAFRRPFRDSTYSPNGQIGFRVNQPTYDDDERNHIDTYVYVPRVGAYAGDDPSGYGRYPAPSHLFDNSLEDVSSGNPPGTVFPANSISMAGPLPSQIGDTNPATAWWRPDGPANSTWNHEFQHALNDFGAAMGEMYSSIAQSITGGTIDASNPYDVPYTSSILRHDNFNPSVNNYYAWEALGSYIAFRFRGTDTTYAGRQDDLLWRWTMGAGSGPADRPDLTNLGHRLVNSQCGECATLSYFSGLAAKDRREVLLHNFRVANYVDNPNLAEGQYGIPPNFGPSPSRYLRFWRDNDGCCFDNLTTLPPETTLTSAQASNPLVISGNRSITCTTPDPCNQMGTFTYPMALDENGAEYWIIRSDGSLNQAGNRLKVKVNPIVCSGRRLMATLIGYTNSDVAGVRTELWTKPEWAQYTSGAKWIDLGQTVSPLEVELPDFGTTYKAAVLVLTLGSYGDFAAGQAPQVVSYSLNLSVTSGTSACTLPPPTLEVASATISDERASFSPSGTEIVYTHYTPGAGDGRIYRKTLGGGAGVALTPGTPAGPQSTPDWSPRGDWVTFDQDTPSGDTHVWAYNLQTAQLSQLTTATRWESFPSFNPNGQEIVYTHGVAYGSTVWEIRKMKLDGSGNTVVYADNRALLYPRWSANGSTIYFLRNDSLFAIPSTGGTPSYVSGSESRIWSFDPPLGTGPWASQIPYTFPCTSTSSSLLSLRDQFTQQQTFPFDQSGKKVGLPRWARDGIRVAFGMGPAGGTDFDLYVGATSCNNAPVLSAPSTYDVEIDLCVPYHRYLSATDADGDPITYQAYYLPSGAMFSGNHFQWTPGPEYALQHFYVVFRALDGKGGVDHKVVKISTSDACLQCPNPPNCIGTRAQRNPDPDLDLPTTFALLQNAPNPVVGTTGIRFDLPEAGFVRLELYDVRGRLVRRLLDRAYAPGRWSVAWDRTDGRGERVSAGVYFYRLTARGFTSQRKMLLVP